MKTDKYEEMNMDEAYIVDLFRDVDVSLLDNDAITKKAHRKIGLFSFGLQRRLKERRKWLAAAIESKVNYGMLFLKRKIKIALTIFSGLLAMGCIVTGVVILFKKSHSGTDA